MKKFLSLGLAASALCGFTVQATDEATIRTILAAWAKGDNLVPNPVAEIVNFVVSKTPVTVSTFSGLATQSLVGRDDGAVAYVLGQTAVRGDGAGIFLWSASSAATTNTWGCSASSGGGRWLAAHPLAFHGGLTNIAIPALTTNSMATFVISTFPAGAALPETGDPVSVAFKYNAAISTNLIASALTQTNNTINISLTVGHNGAATTAMTNDLVVTYWKTQP